MLKKYPGLTGYFTEGETYKCMFCISVLINISVVTTVPSAASPWSPALGLMLRTERSTASSATANYSVFTATASGLVDLL